MFGNPIVHTLFLDYESLLILPSFPEWEMFARLLRGGETNRQEDEWKRITDSTRNFLQLPLRETKSFPVVIQGEIYFSKIIEQRFTLS